MPELATFLSFERQAEEAARHYVSIFPDSRITAITHYGEGAPMPAGTVMTVEFELEGRPFVALNVGQKWEFTHAISISVLCDTQEEVDRYWDRLGDGGRPVACGWLVDRFGVSWQVTPKVMVEILRRGNDDPGVRRAFDAMGAMVKLDVAAIERAYAGR